MKTIAKNPSIMSVLADWAALMRFQYQQNYLIVVIGALLFGESIDWNVAKNVAVQYFSFAICLYGGIYIMNAVSDAAVDARHPTKYTRPIPAGRISTSFATVLIAVHWGGAFVFSFFWESSTRFWPVYSAFIIINILYSFWFRQTRFRFTIAITSCLRLYVGAAVANAQDRVPMVAYLAAFTFMAAIQAVKIRLETTGDVHFHPKTVGAPFEFIVGILVPFTTVAGLSQCPDTLMFAAGIVFAMGAYGGFILLPAVSPQTFGILLGIKPVKTEVRTRWLRLAKVLWNKNDYSSLALLGSLRAFSMVNVLLMGIEDTLFPALFSPFSWNEAPHFLLGHQSTTTNSLIETMVFHNDVMSSTLFDVMCPSILMKACLWPFKGLFDFLAKDYDTLKHQVRMSNLSEDTMFLMHRAMDQMMMIFFSDVVGSSELEGILYESHCSHSESDVLFMLRCVKRVIVYNNALSRYHPRIYVGQAMTLTRKLPLLDDILPKQSRYVLSVCDEAAALQFWAQRYAARSGLSLETREMQTMVRQSYEVYSKDTFTAVNRLTKKKKKTALLTVEGSTFAADPVPTIQSVFRHLNLPSDTAVCEACVSKHSQQREQNPPCDSKTVPLLSTDTAQESF